MMRILIGMSVLLLLGACSDDATTAMTCDPNQPSCTIASWCNMGQCEGCPQGTYNCDRIGVCTATPCTTATCTPSAASTCPENQYCVGQSCTACQPGMYNCDRNDATGCRSNAPCGAGTPCVPSTTTSTCGQSLYCAANVCTACNQNMYNCDKDDTNLCEQSTPCSTSGNCTPSDGASTCGTSQYCTGVNCTSCQPDRYNCDKKDSTGCESPTVCDNTQPPDQINGHFKRSACQETLFQVDISEGPSTCSSVDTLIQFSVREGNRLPPTSGRTYTIINQPTMPTADGQAIAVYLGTAGTGSVESGTLTVDPSSGAQRTGSYNLRLTSGTEIKGAYRADECTMDPVCN